MQLYQAFLLAAKSILIMAESFLSTAELRAMFDEIDTNKNGTIDLKELDQAMSRLQMPLGKDTSRYVFLNKFSLTKLKLLTICLTGKFYSKLIQKKMEQFLLMSSQRW